MADQKLWLTALIKASKCVSIHDYYTIGEPLGRGKFSVVHRATNKKNLSEVAVKILPKGSLKASDKEFLRSEVAILRLVRHPNVVRLLDVFESTEYLYLVMEKVTAGDLSELIRRMGANKAPEQVVQQILRRVICGVRYLHRQNIVHRDIKPENILIITAPTDESAASFKDSPSVRSIHCSSNVAVEESRAKSVGHLSPKQLSVGPPSSESPTPTFPAITLTTPRNSCQKVALYNRANKTGSSNAQVITPGSPGSPPIQRHNGNGGDRQEILLTDGSGEVIRIVDVKITDFGLAKILAPTLRVQEPLGTLAYAAPEVILGMPYDKSVDMWSLGVVSYELLSGGRLPFYGNSSGQIAAAAVQGQYAFSDDLWHDVSDSAKDFVRRLLRKSPCERITAEKALNHPWMMRTYSHNSVSPTTSASSVEMPSSPPPVIGTKLVTGSGKLEAVHS